MTDSIDRQMAGTRQLLQELGLQHELEQALANEENIVGATIEFFEPLLAMLERATTGVELGEIYDLTTQVLAAAERLPEMPVEVQRILGRLVLTFIASDAFPKVITGLLELSADAQIARMKDELIARQLHDLFTTLWTRWPAKKTELLERIVRENAAWGRDFDGMRRAYRQLKGIEHDDGPMTANQLLMAHGVLAENRYKSYLRLLLDLFVICGYAVPISGSESLGKLFRGVDRAIGEHALGEYQHLVSPDVHSKRNIIFHQIALITDPEDAAYYLKALHDMVGMGGFVELGLQGTVMSQLRPFMPLILRETMDDFSSLQPYARQELESGRYDIMNMFNQLGGTPRG